MSAVAAPSGLDEMRAAMLNAERHGMAALLGIDVAEVEQGRVVITAQPDAAHYNLLGVVHGGFAATLLDTACGLAAWSASPGNSACLTLEIKVAYHAPLTEEVGMLRAVGEVLSISRRTAHTEAKLLDSTGRLFASATSTLIVKTRAQEPRST